MDKENIEKNKLQHESDAKLYDLKLHQGYTTSFGVYIMRVPGGWIYDCWDQDKDCFKNGIFIPLNNEFQ